MEKLSKEQEEAVIEVFDNSWTSLEFKSHLKEKGLIESDAVIGKWYKFGAALIFFNGKVGNGCTHGFKSNGDWCTVMGFHKKNSNVLATSLEVEIAFIRKFERNNNSFEHYQWYNDGHQCLYGWNEGETSTELYRQGKWTAVAKKEKQYITVDGKTYREI